MNWQEYFEDKNIREGDRVYLKDYRGWSDYVNHNGQNGVITNEETGDTNLSLELRWDNGEISYVSPDNVTRIPFTD